MQFSENSTIIRPQLHPYVFSSRSLTLSFSFRKTHDTTSPLEPSVAWCLHRHCSFPTFPPLHGFVFLPALLFVIPNISSSVACFNLFSQIHLSRAHTSLSTPWHGIGSGERCVRGIQNWKKGLGLCDVSLPGYLIEPSCLWDTDLANEGNLQEMRRWSRCGEGGESREKIQR